MDKHILQQLLDRMPNDASEIIIYGHDAMEVSFSSVYDCSQHGAYPTQKGTYKGPKKRWKMSFQSLPGVYKYPHYLQATADPFQKPESENVIPFPQSVPQKLAEGEEFITSKDQDQSNVIEFNDGTRIELDPHADGSTPINMDDIPRTDE